jgi:hypothetical protein
MGDLRSGNGDGRPDEGEPSARSSAVPSHDDRYGLPDFPPDWGPIVIPDDAADLDRDAAKLRKERRRIARQALLRKLTGRPPRPGTDAGQPSVGVPLIIMAVAVLTTMISLFVVTWGRDAGEKIDAPTVAGTGQPTAAVGAKALTELSLIDATGKAVRFGTLLPAVVLLVDGCACDNLVSDIGRAAPAGIRIVPVGRAALQLVGVAPSVHALADPDGALRARLTGDTATSSTATAILLDATATVTRTIPKLESADQITPADLAHLLA